MQVDPLDHIPLVWYLVGRNRSPLLEPEDAFQVGFIGLMKAAESYLSLIHI